jgi:predicted glycosyltransferase
MSKGHGRIGRGIIAAFHDEPDNAFTTEDLVERVYAGVNQIVKKHRVALIRAAKNLVDAGTIVSMAVERLGKPLVFFDPYNLASCAMARMKSGQRYRVTDPRDTSSERTEDDLRAMIAPGGKKHHLVAEGGTYWRCTQERIAIRAGTEA